MLLLDAGVVGHEPIDLPRDALDERGGRRALIRERERVRLERAPQAFDDHVFLHRVRQPGQVWRLRGVLRILVRHM